MSKAKKSKAVSKSGKADTAAEQDTICDGCCTSIEENEHEAIQCEGSCQKWYHRLCAGVSKYHYDKLADSPSPFVCWLCSDSLQKAVIRELQQELVSLKHEFMAKLDANHSAIAALKEENAALKVALGQNGLQQQSSHDISNPARSGNEWSRVKPRRRRKPQQAPRPNSTASAVQTSPKPEDEENAPTEDQSTTRKQRTQISGARKIWGTHSSATTRAVSKAIATLTKVSDSNFTIKRKYKMSHSGSAGGRLTHWWFVIRANEEFLGQLEHKWNQVQLQVNWKLEPLYTFADLTQQPNDSTSHPPLVTDPSQAATSTSTQATEINSPASATTHSNPTITTPQPSPPSVDAPFLGESNPISLPVR